LTDRFEIKTASRNPTQERTIAKFQELLVSCGSASGISRGTLTMGCAESALLFLVEKGADHDNADEVIAALAVVVGAEIVESYIATLIAHVMPPSEQGSACATIDIAKRKAIMRSAQWLFEKTRKRFSFRALFSRKLSEPKESFRNTEEAQKLLEKLRALYLSESPIETIA
jgi:hypothetical protein